MPAGYGEPPEQQQVAQHGQQYQDYPNDYYYPMDTFRGAMPSDQAAQVRIALFQLDALEDAEFSEWEPMLRAVIEMVARIPGIDHNAINELNRDMEDIVDIAHAQGRRRIVASKLQKFVFKLRAYVSQGDTVVTGPTGVTTMVTTNQNVKQDVRYPQQPATQGFWPWSRKGGQQ